MGELSAENALLYKHRILVFYREGKCLVKLGLVIYRRNSDARAAGAGLYYAGVADALNSRRDALGRAVAIKFYRRWSADAGILQKLFGNILIHRQEAAYVSAAGVGYIKHVERSLKHAVFSHISVKSEKGYVSELAKLDNVFTDKLGAASAAALYVFKLLRGGGA